MILAIDFDGVIHDNEHPIEGRRMGPPIFGAKESLDFYRKTGHTIHVYTIWQPESHHVIMDWMDYYHIPFDLVTNRKQHADVYVDNKAVNFDEWQETMERIASADWL